MSKMMNRSYRCVRNVIGSLLIACVTLIFIHSSDFAQQKNVLLKQEEIQVTSKGIKHASTCCRSPDYFLDICGRLNCTSTCSDSQPLTRELENENSKNSHSNDRAFFLETSGRDALNFRQACTVESLAFINPNLTVYVLFIGGKINSNSAPLKTLKEKYSNIRLIGVNLEEYVTGTPLERWYYCSNWRQGQYHVSHLSDGLRFLTLAKYGGYYFDLDVIAVRPVTNYRNFVAAESDDEFGSGAIHSDYKHPLMDLAVRDFVANYRSDIWGHNGPVLLKRVLKNWCKVEDIQLMDHVRCRGFSALPKTSFCPLHFDEVKDLFYHRTENESKKPGWLTDQVIGVHTWNKLSIGEPIYKNSTQYYAWLAQTHCPLIFSIAPDVF